MSFEAIKRREMIALLATAAGSSLIGCARGPGGPSGPHCDALGSYSDVRDNAGGSGDTRGRKFLRGYQVTGSEGKVEFQTIYPGWCQGRCVHVHYMIRTNPTSEVGHERARHDQRSRRNLSPWWY